MVIHRRRESPENAASDRIAAAHERNDESLAFIDEVVALRGAALHGGEVEDFDAEGLGNVLRGETPSGVFMGLLEG
jgi:hypothetical protein